MIFFDEDRISPNNASITIFNSDGEEVVAFLLYWAFIFNIINVVSESTITGVIEATLYGAKADTGRIGYGLSQQPRRR